MLKASHLRGAAKLTAATTQTKAKYEPIDDELSSFELGSLYSAP